MSNQNPLLNDKKSVTGAAKSIEGLLDPETATIKTQKEAAPVEPKESEVKAEDTQEVQQKPEEQLEDKVQESFDEEEALKENAIEEQTTDYHQVKVNGEVIELKNVVDRSFIQVHKGNYTSDILGCILLGKTVADINGDGIPDVTSSGTTVKEFLTHIEDTGTICIERI